MLYKYTIVIERYSGAYEMRSVILPALLVVAVFFLLYAAVELTMWADMAKSVTNCCAGI